MQTVPLNPHATVDWAAIGSGHHFGGQGSHADFTGHPGSSPAATPTTGA
jgi:hypothetical protein